MLVFVFKNRSIFTFCSDVIGIKDGLESVLNKADKAGSNNRKATDNKKEIK